jgi:hypothetical protein
VCFVIALQLLLVSGTQQPLNFNFTCNLTNFVANRIPRVRTIFFSTRHPLFSVPKPLVFLLSLFSRVFLLITGKHVPIFVYNLLSLIPIWNPRRYCRCFVNFTSEAMIFPQVIQGYCWQAVGELTIVHFHFQFVQPAYKRAGSKCWGSGHFMHLVKIFYCTLWAPKLTNVFGTQIFVAVCLSHISWMLRAFCVLDRCLLQQLMVLRVIDRDS